MRLDIKGMEDINSTMSDRLVTKFSDLIQEAELKNLYASFANRSVENKTLNAKDTRNDFVKDFVEQPLGKDSNMRDVERSHPPLNKSA